MEAGLIADGEFVVAGGGAAVAFESVDAAFDGVTASVVLAAEAGWTSPGSASVLAVADLVGRFGDRREDAAPAQVGAVGAGAVGLVAGQAGCADDRPRSGGR
ncbi:hypothetical protein GCM10010404_32480 [Nonomuraea africana]